MTGTTHDVVHPATTASLVVKVMGISAVVPTPRGMPAVGGTWGRPVASMAPEPGGGWAYSPTPASRWALAQREAGTTGEAAPPDYRPQLGARTHPDYFRSK